MEKDKTTTCYHCGDDCQDEQIFFDEKNFCCNGCKSIYEILNQNELGEYYQIELTPGLKGKQRGDHKYKFLDIEEIASPLYDFEEEDQRVVRLFLPEIHCASCIWLLENLHRINKGILFSEVNFLKKEAMISFNLKEISFRELAILLDKIGYPPKFDTQKKNKFSNKKLYIKIGVTFFCFGNIMLFSFPEYLNPDKTFLDSYRRFFTYLILGFSIPVILYSAKDYLVSAFKAIKAKTINLDVPITLGILTLYVKSAYDIFSDNGPGYMDSFVGFILFLLIGKWFQDKTYQVLSFNRNYQSYFPLAVTQVIDEEEVIKPVEKIAKGDVLLIKNEEIIPADAVLLKGEGSIDYSFVTGESRQVQKKVGEQVYAGGKQTGKNIEVEVVKSLNQSYLTQLWNQHVFKKEDKDNLLIFNNKLSNYFIIGVLIVAVIAAGLWAYLAPEHIVNVIVSVLIVACPCALALSIPFTFGNTLRVAGSNGLYLKNSEVIEKLGKVTDIVFDKTGTLTYQNKTTITFQGNQMSTTNSDFVCSMVKNSSHPLSRLLYNHLKYNNNGNLNVQQFEEKPGKGLYGTINDSEVYIGSGKWVGAKDLENTLTTRVYIKIDDQIKGFYQLENNYREGFEKLIEELGSHFTLHLLSGDNDSEKDKLKKYFKDESVIKFNQQPIDKLDYIKSIKSDQNTIMMIGDGLNDAGALKQSDIGVVIAEDVYNFSPACDGILDAAKFNQINKFIGLGKYSLTVLKISYVISLLYNTIGLSFAFSNQLSPLIAAILMPLSSISVVLVTTLLIRLYSRKIF